MIQHTFLIDWDIMVGIAYRKEFAEELINSNEIKPDFIEVAPENWIDIGGFWGNVFQNALERFPLYLHGLSLSIGSPDEVDFNFLKKVKKFIKETKAILYSEHLSFSKCDNAHTYDLLPIPFSEESVKHVALKIKQVQDYLEQKIAIENVSYYASIEPEMTESEFINAIADESDCDLLLDVNNVYVNAFNHNYDPKEFIKNMPLDKVAYFHIAGHDKVSDDLIIDTHGQDIIDPVYELYDYTNNLMERKIPTLLERDFNIPALEQLQTEISTIKSIQTKYFK